MKCEFCKFLYLLKGTKGVCQKYNGLTGRVTPEDYCSRGEHRVYGNDNRSHDPISVPGTTAVLQETEDTERPD